MPARTNQAPEGGVTYDNANPYYTATDPVVHPPVIEPTLDRIRRENRERTKRYKASLERAVR